ncbi:MAG: hypothetical protein ACK52X_00230, partial [bacterium]
RQYRSLQSRLLQCRNLFLPPCDLLMLRIVTPRIRDFHSLVVLSVERTVIFVIQGAHSTFAIDGVSCSKDSFVVNQTLVFQIKFCGKSPALRVAAKRYEKPLREQRPKSKERKWHINFTIFIGRESQISMYELVKPLLVMQLLSFNRRCLNILSL